MSVAYRVVHKVFLHTSPTKEMTIVKKRVRKPPQVVVQCVGERKEPSKEALDRFVEIYVRMVKENQKKLRGMMENDIR